MKKTGEFILIGSILFLFYCTTERRITPNWYKQVIESYLTENLPDRVSYQGLETFEIDQAYLEKIPLIQNSLLFLRDTLEQKTRLMADLGLSEPGFEKNAQQRKLDLEELSSLLPSQLEHNHDLHKLLDTPAFRNARPAAALDEVLNDFQQEIEALDSYLGFYNLSIYRRPVFNNQRLIVYHRYQVYFQGESKTEAGLFEIDRENHKILSERPLSSML